MRAAARKSRLNSTNSDLYSLAKTRIAADFHAVTNGTNGWCGTVRDAGPGYDFITGLGSPQAVNLIAGRWRNPRIVSPLWSLHNGRHNGDARHSGQRWRPSPHQQ